MIMFSERQLKIPQMSKPVYLVTGGMSKFGSIDTLTRNWFKLKQRGA